MYLNVPTFFEQVFNLLLRLNVPLSILALVGATVILFLLGVLAKRAGLLTDIAFKVLASVALTWTVFFIWAKPWEPIVRTLFLLAFCVTGLITYFQFRHVLKVNNGVEETLKDTQIIRRQLPWVAVVAGLVGVVVLLTFILQTQTEANKRAVNELKKAEDNHTAETQKFRKAQEQSNQTLSALHGDINRLSGEVDSIKVQGKKATKLADKAAVNSANAAKLASQVNKKIDKTTPPIIIQELKPKTTDDNDKNEKEDKSFLRRLKDFFKFSAQRTTVPTEEQIGPGTLYIDDNYGTNGMLRMRPSVHYNDPPVVLTPYIRIDSSSGAKPEQIWPDTNLLVRYRY